MNSLSIKPFTKKSFFLDLKDFPKKKKLIKDLELLGAREEVCLNKNVSFVVSDKVLVKSEFKTPSTTFSNSKSISPHLFKDSPSGTNCSPAPNSPNVEQKVFIEPIMPLSRTQSLLLKAKEKQSQLGTKNIMDICKQWNIKVYSLQKVLSWIDKYKCKYYKEHYDKKERVVSSVNVQKIYPPLIKFEDVKRRYKPKFKSFISWTTMTDATILQNVVRLVKTYKQHGNVNDPVRSILKDVNAKPLNLSQYSGNNLKTVCETASVTKQLGCNSISNSVSVLDSKAFIGENPLCKKTKKDKQLKKEKRHYCEICAVHFTDNEAHYKKKTHLKFMNTASNYEVVEDIISSLPKREDFFAKIEREQVEKEISDAIQLFEDPVVLGASATDATNNCEVNADCRTEAYSFNPNDFISASCSSPCSSLPYLERLETHTEAKENINLRPPTLVHNSLDNFDSMLSPNCLHKQSILTSDSTCKICDQSLYTSTIPNIEGINTSIVYNNPISNCVIDMNLYSDKEMGASNLVYNYRDVFSLGIENKIHITEQQNTLDHCQVSYFYKPCVTEVYDLNSEVPLDLSNNIKNEKFTCHSYNSINDSANIVNVESNLNDDFIILNTTNILNNDSADIIDVPMLLNNTIITSDATKLSNNDGSMNTVNISSTSSDNPFIHVHETKISNLDNAKKTVDLIKDLIEIDTINVMDISNNLVKTMDETKISYNSLANSTNLNNISNDNLSGKVDIAKPFSPFVNVVDKMNDSNYEVANSDHDTEIYISDPESDQEMHALVASCLSNIDKSMENDEDDSPANKLNKVLDFKALKDVVPVANDMEMIDLSSDVKVHEPISCVEHLLCKKSVRLSSGITTTEPSAMAVNSPTKRKYSLNECSMECQPCKNSIVEQCCEISIKVPPAKKMCFQSGNTDANCGSFNNSNELFHKRSPISSSFPSTCFKDVSNAEVILHPPSYTVESLNNQVPTDSKNYADRFKSDQVTSASNIPSWECSSDDVYIVIDETEESDDDCCGSKDKDHDFKCNLFNTNNSTHLHFEEKREACNVNENLQCKRLCLNTEADTGIENKAECLCVDIASETETKDAVHNQIKDSLNTDVVTKEEKCDVYDENGELDIEDKSKIQINVDNFKVMQDELEGTLIKEKVSERNKIDNSNNNVNNTEQCEENALQTAQNMNHSFNSNAIWDTNKVDCSEIEHLNNVVEEKNSIEIVCRAEDIFNMEDLKTTETYLHTTKFAASTSVGSEEAIPCSTDNTSCDSQSLSNSNENSIEVASLSTSSPTSNCSHFPDAHLSVNENENRNILHIVYLNAVAPLNHVTCK